MNIHGLTSREWQTFHELLIKANFTQIKVMEEELMKERSRRSKALAGVEQE